MLINWTVEFMLLYKLKNYSNFITQQNRQMAYTHVKSFDSLVRTYLLKLILFWEEHDKLRVKSAYMEFNITKIKLEMCQVKSISTCICNYSTISTHNKITFRSNDYQTNLPKDLYFKKRQLQALNLEWSHKVKTSKIGWLMVFKVCSLLDSDAE